MDAAPGAEATFALDRASLDHLIADPPACDPDRIRAAIERADYDDAAIRALARAKLGLALPAELVTDLLVGVEIMEVFFALARHLGGEARQPMLELLRSGRFADDAIGADQMSYTAFVLWQLEERERVRPVLVPRLRHLVRHPRLYVRGAGLAGWLAAELGDPHLTELFEDHYGSTGSGRKLAETVGRLALELWHATLDDKLAILPERVPEQALAGMPVRAAPKVGRNELCPCGSGKKFKRCCAERPAPAGADPSRAERLRALEPRLEGDQVDLLSRADLARLELPRLRDLTVIEVMRRQAQLHDWRRACLALDELTRRRGKDFADDHLQDVIHDALHARRYEDARRLLARLDAAVPAPEARLEVALAARDPDALAQLEAAAVAVVAETDEGAGVVDLACVVLHTLPGLGILIARGALGAGGLLDGETLLEEIEEARDELQLPPGDPALELFEALGGVQEQKLEEAETKAERARLAQTAASLRADLDDAAGRLAVMQRQVAEHQHELERTERTERVERIERPGRTAAEADRRPARTPAEEQERRTLRGKIEELQGLIREGNQERGDLRRQLSAVTESQAGAQAAHEAPASARELDGDDDDLEELPADAARAVQIPRFSAAAAAALEAVPRNIAAATMRAIGALAGGDPAAWRGVKQAKDMPRQVLMARVGIHHRLLFRTHDGLDVLDLVTRESLMMTLKRLRSL
jgi:hypothetical protein